MEAGEQAMRRSRKTIIYRIRMTLTILIVVGHTGLAQGITVAELREIVSRGDPVTLIDLRSRTEFAVSHIPGAVHIPANLLSSKKLPSLGRVIVYGDGFDQDNAISAVSSLKRLPGIQPEMLDGGMGAWEADHGVTTQRPGLSEPRLRQLSYEELLKAISSNPDLVLVDLRGSESASDPRKHGEGLTDLATIFPGVPVIKAGELGSKPRQRFAGVPPAVKRNPMKLYVLVDDGRGLAERAALSFRAAGVSRLAAIAGGEEALKRSGRPGVGTRVMRIKP